MKFWHGTSLEAIYQRDKLLPVEKAKRRYKESLSAYVYVTNDWQHAWSYAFGEKPIVCRVDPIGDVVPDPEYPVGMNVSFMCREAWINKIFLSPKQRVA